MSQSASKQLVQIIGHPSKPRTSLRAASEAVSRGIMRWLTFPFTVVMVPDAERLQAQNERNLASERGGTELWAIWGVGKVPATEKQPEWLPRELGYSVLGARIIATEAKPTP